MKKQSIAIIAVVALVLGVAVGYALFSETITINGTATAKGDFDMVVTCETGFSTKLGSPSSYGYSDDYGYSNDTCSVVDNTVSLSTDFLYPSLKGSLLLRLLIEVL